MKQVQFDKKFSIANLVWAKDEALIVKQMTSNKFSFVEKISYEEKYFDTEDGKLILSNYWLRERDGIRDLKAPIETGRLKTDMESCVTISEIEAIDEKVHKICKEAPLIVFAEMKVERLVFLSDKFSELSVRIDKVDDHRVGEVVVKFNKSKVFDYMTANARKLIADEVSVLIRSTISRICSEYKGEKGKLTHVLREKKPKFYAKMLAAGVVDYESSEDEEESEDEATFTNPDGYSCFTLRNGRANMLKYDREKKTFLKEKGVCGPDGFEIYGYEEGEDGAGQLKKLKYDEEKKTSC